METLFEDELILAVNKPSGIPSASLHAPDQDTCERRILSREGATGFELLHRLDTGTSGVLLFAKNSNTFKEMRAKFQERSILKRYWAWSAWAPGTPHPPLPPLPYRLDLPLGHHPKSKKRMIALPPGKTRRIRGQMLPAVTHIEAACEELFFDHRALRIQVRIETGVMHQIRVHLRHLGLPLMGDPLYGPPSDQGQKPALRLGLHASFVEFELRGARYQIRAPFLQGTE